MCGFKFLYYFFCYCLCCVILVGFGIYDNEGDVDFFFNGGEY